MLPGLDAPRTLRRGTYSPSALVRHAGVRGLPGPEVAHHNIHFGGEWAGAFRALLDDGRRMPDPSVLVTVPTVDDPGQAPPGCSVLYALEPVPNLDGDIDWTTERPVAAARLADHVTRLGYPSDVVVEEVVDPLDWERDGMERGTPFALSHRFLQSGPFRPPNLEHRAPGLVFAGSATRPGVGVPLVLLSGRLAADRVDALP
jgi:phytoene desaturase